MSGDSTGYCYQNPVVSRTLTPSGDDAARTINFDFLVSADISQGENLRTSEFEFELHTSEGDLVGRGTYNTFNATSAFPSYGDVTVTQTLRSGEFDLFAGSLLFVWSTPPTGDVVVTVRRVTDRNYGFDESILNMVSPSSLDILLGGIIKLFRRLADVEVSRAATSGGGGGGVVFNASLLELTSSESNDMVTVNLIYNSRTEDSVTFSVGSSGGGGGADLSNLNIDFSVRSDTSGYLRLLDGTTVLREVQLTAADGDVVLQSKAGTTVLTLRDGSVTGSKIVSGSIGTAHLADGAATSSKVGTLANSNYGTGTVTGGHSGGSATGSLALNTIDTQNLDSNLRSAVAQGVIGGNYVATNGDTLLRKTDQILEVGNRLSVSQWTNLFDNPGTDLVSMAGTWVYGEFNSLDTTSGGLGSPTWFPYARCFSGATTTERDRETRLHRLGIALVRILNESTDENGDVDRCDYARVPSASIRRIPFAMRIVDSGATSNRFNNVDLPGCHGNETSYYSATTDNVGYIATIVFLDGQLSQNDWASVTDGRIRVFTSSSQFNDRTDNTPLTVAEIRSRYTLATSTSGILVPDLEGHLRLSDDFTITHDVEVLRDEVDDLNAIVGDTDSIDNVTEVVEQEEFYSNLITYFNPNGDTGDPLYYPTRTPEKTEVSPGNVSIVDSTVDVPFRIRFINPTLNGGNSLALIYDTSTVTGDDILIEGELSAIVVGTDVGDKNFTVDTTIGLKKLGDNEYAYYLSPDDGVHITQLQIAKGFSSFSFSDVSDDPSTAFTITTSDVIPALGGEIGTGVPLLDIATNYELGWYIKEADDFWTFSYNPARLRDKYTTTVINRIPIAHQGDADGPMYTQTINPGGNIYEMYGTGLNSVENFTSTPALTGSGFTVNVPNIMGQVLTVTDTQGEGFTEVPAMFFFLRFNHIYIFSVVMPSLPEFENIQVGDLPGSITLAVGNDSITFDLSTVAPAHTTSGSDTRYNDITQREWIGWRVENSDVSSGDVVIRDAFTNGVSPVITFGDNDNRFRFSNQSGAVPALPIERDIVAHVEDSDGNLASVWKGDLQSQSWTELLDISSLSTEGEVPHLLVERNPNRQPSGEPLPRLYMTTFSGVDVFLFGGPEITSSVGTITIPRNLTGLRAVRSGTTFDVAVAIQNLATPVVSVILSGTNWSLSDFPTTMSFATPGGVTNLINPTSFGNTTLGGSAARSVSYSVQTSRVYLDGEQVTSFTSTGGNVDIGLYPNLAEEVEAVTGATANEVLDGSFIRKWIKEDRGWKQTNPETLRGPLDPRQASGGQFLGDDATNNVVGTIVSDFGSARRSGSIGGHNYTGAAKILNVRFGGQIRTAYMQFLETDTANPLVSSNPETNIALHFGLVGNPTYLPFPVRFRCLIINSTTGVGRYSYYTRAPIDDVNNSLPSVSGIAVTSTGHNGRYCPYILDSGYRPQEGDKISAIDLIQGGSNSPITMPNVTLDQAPVPSYSRDSYYYQLKAENENEVDRIWINPEEQGWRILSNFGADLDAINERFGFGAHGFIATNVHNLPSHLSENGAGIWKKDLWMIQNGTVYPQTGVSGSTPQTNFGQFATPSSWTNSTVLYKGLSKVTISGTDYLITVLHGGHSHTRLRVLITALSDNGNLSTSSRGDGGFVDYDLTSELAALGIQGVVGHTFYQEGTDNYIAVHYRKEDSGEFHIHTTTLTFDSSLTFSFAGSFFNTRIRADVNNTIEAVSSELFTIGGRQHIITLEVDDGHYAIKRRPVNINSSDSNRLEIIVDEVPTLVETVTETNTSLGQGQDLSIEFIGDNLARFDIMERQRYLNYDAGNLINSVQNIRDDLDRINTLPLKTNLHGRVNFPPSNVWSASSVLDLVIPNNYSVLVLTRDINGNTQREEISVDSILALTPNNHETAILNSIDLPFDPSDHSQGHLHVGRTATNQLLFVASGSRAIEITSFDLELPKFDASDAVSPGGGLTQAQVDARVRALTQNWAESGNGDPVPHDKLGNVAPWATTLDTSAIPAAKLTNAPGLTQAQVDARVVAGTQDWARDATTAIPTAKMSTNARAAASITVLTQAQYDALTPVDGHLYFITG